MTPPMTRKGPGDIIAFSGGVAIVLDLIHGSDMPEEECCLEAREYDWFRVLRTDADQVPRLGWLRFDVIDRWKG